VNGVEAARFLSWDTRQGRQSACAGRAAWLRLDSTKLTSCPALRLASSSTGLHPVTSAANVRGGSAMPPILIVKADIPDRPGRAKSRHAVIGILVNRGAEALNERPILRGFGFVESLDDSGRHERFRLRDHHFDQTP
jgi:hypothetical protein